MSRTFRYLFWFGVGVWLIFMVLFFYGCANKNLRVESFDDQNRPIVIEGSVNYFCTDTNTKGFSAQFGEDIKIGLASQEAATKTELMLEFMKMLNTR